MPQSTPKRNRGPAAAAENRSALLGAARQLFAERGFHVPLSAVARAADVSQGVLYRHFPNRLELALAVFEENFADLGAIAADPDEETFARLWARLVEMTITDTAFLEMSIDGRRSYRSYDGPQRLRNLIAPALGLAQAAGTVDPTLTSDDVLTALRITYGLAVTAVDGTTPEAITDALAMIAHRWPGL